MCRESNIGGRVWNDFVNNLPYILSRPNYGEHALVIITTILSIILIVGLILGIYKRWQQVVNISL